MSVEDASHGPEWRRVQVVHGEPYEVEGRTLIPVARIVSFGRARGTVGQRRIGGRLGALVRISPLAVLDHSGDHDRKIAIHDETAAKVHGSMAAAVAILLFFCGVRWLLRRWRGRACCCGSESGR